MTRRIFGIETEYGVAYDHLGGRRLSPEEIARYLFRRVVAWGRSSNVFLPNGSRLYLDVGSHPEYATAECDRLPDLVAQDRAGESLMRDLLADAQQHIDEDGHEGRAHLLKNNTDSSGNSYGSHENYLIRRSVEFTRMTGVLLPFLVARQAMVGAGAVIPAAAVGSATDGPAPATFGFSARSDHMWEGVSSATTRSRPIINARDEPHADAEKYRRLHVIVGDSSRSEATTELKVGTVGLILDLIETGARIEHLHLRNPIKDIRALARDLTARTPMELDDGRRVNALDILGAYLEPAARLVEAGDHGLGDDAAAARVVDLWQRSLTALETGDFDPVATELDWVIKRRLLDRHRERHQLAWDDARVARLDLSYHDITPGGGIFTRLEEGGLVTRVTDDAAVARAVDSPPSTTRASLRGRFIAAAHEKARDFTVDWVHLRLNDATQRAVTCKDPFVADDERVDALIAAV